MTFMMFNPKEVKSIKSILKHIGICHFTPFSYRDVFKYVARRLDTTPGFLVILRDDISNINPRNI